MKYMYVMLYSLNKLPCLRPVKFALGQGKLSEFFSFRCVATLLKFSLDILSISKPKIDTCRGC